MTTYTIYTNRTTTGKTAIKTGLSILDAEQLCTTINNDIKVPRGQSVYDMIGALWYVPE